MAHLRKPPGRGPSLACRLSGSSRKWLCLLRITRSRSRSDPWLRYHTEVISDPDVCHQDISAMARHYHTPQEPSQSSSRAG